MTGNLSSQVPAGKAAGAAAEPADAEPADAEPADAVGDRPTDRLIEALRQFVWGLWRDIDGTAGGGDGCVPSLAVDPEQLLAFTDRFANVDEALDDHALDWCARNARLLSGARLQAFVRADGYGRYAGQIKRGWRAGAPTAPLDHPAQIGLRLRAIFGVSARADVLGFLLADRGYGLTAGQIADEAGYSRRGLSAALEGLRLGGLLEARRRGTHVFYGLAKPHEVAPLVGPLPDVFPRWRAMFRVLERSSTSQPGIICVGGKPLCAPHEV